MAEPSEGLILIAEDEPKIAKLVAEYLEAHGFSTHIVSRGDEVQDELNRLNPNLLLLDLMLPGKDGMTICREIRGERDLPIIMLTARGDEIDRVLGLELGADDYICKPFSPREVVARVKSVLRRSTVAAPKPDGLFQINPDRMEARIRGELLDLTPYEFNLLKTFCNFPGRVFSRDQLLDVMDPGMRYVTDRAVDSHVKNLRKKISTVVPDRQFIRTVYSVGYKFVHEENGRD